jgi:hypothetical protein
METSRFWLRGMFQRVRIFTVYDTIKRYKVYVSISELNFTTKLKLLTAGGEWVVGQGVAFIDLIFDVVKEFIYLESLVTPNKDVRLEIHIFRIVQTIAFGASFTSNKIHHLQDLPVVPKKGDESFFCV